MRKCRLLSMMRKRLLSPPSSPAPPGFDFQSPAFSPPCPPPMHSVGIALDLGERGIRFLPPKHLCSWMERFSTRFPRGRGCWQLALYFCSLKKKKKNPQTAGLIKLPRLFPWPQTMQFPFDAKRKYGLSGHGSRGEL